MKQIPTEKYREIVKEIPILCVDLIVQLNDRYLLLKRANEPLKERYWVPGGRVHKGEHLKKAAIRILKQETGLTAKRLIFEGLYEGMFKKGANGPIHTVSVVYFVPEVSGKLKVDTQSTGWLMTKKLPTDFTVHT